jgi:hypothetical protein
MHHSSTLYVGLGVHKESIAVTYALEERVAEIVLRGTITNAGNTFARRALMKEAWADRYPAKVSRHLQGAWRRHSRPSRTSVGRSGCTSASVSDPAWHEGNRPAKWSSRSPGKWPR